MNREEYNRTDKTASEMERIKSEYAEASKQVKLFYDSTQELSVSSKCSNYCKSLFPNVYLCLLLRYFSADKKQSSLHHFMDSPKRSCARG